MSVPLSDTRLTEIRERVPSAVCAAAHPEEVDKDHVWVTGSLSGTNRCAACHLSQRALDSDEAVLLAEVDRLRAENAGLDDLRLRAIDKNDELRAEFREAMDNYHGAAAEAKKLRAEVERLAAMRVSARDVLYDFADGKVTAEQATWRVAAALADAAELPAISLTAPTT